MFWAPSSDMPHTVTLTKILLGVCAPLRYQFFFVAKPDAAYFLAKEAAAPL